MKKYFLLMKKRVLCFTAVLLTITAMTVTMTVAAPNKCIHLRLNEKPAHMSTYEWCKKRAEVNVNIKATVLLVFMKVRSEKDWKERKHNAAKPYSKSCYYRTVPMPKNLQDCVYKVFNYHEVVKVVKPTSIRKEYYSNNTAKSDNKAKANNKVKKIVVETEDFGTIEIMAVSGYSIGWTTVQKGGHIIGLSPSEIKRLKLSDGSIEGIIGHELTHIIYDDAFEWRVVRNIYCENRYDWNLNYSEYATYLYAFCRACEAEADIVGTFGNPRWARGLIDAFKKFSSESYHYYSKYSTHPTCKQRIAYLEAMYKSLNNE